MFRNKIRSFSFGDTSRHECRSVCVYSFDTKKNRITVYIDLCH